MDQQTKENIIQIAENGIPIHKYLGLKIEALEKDYVRIAVPFKSDFIGDFRSKRWHGGIIATIMDSVGGVIGIANFNSPHDKLSTIDLRIDYLRGAIAETITFEGKLVRMGNRIMVTKVEAFQGEVLVAEGKGVYNFLRA